jgi:hypothetical protein
MMRIRAIMFGSLVALLAAGRGAAAPEPGATLPSLTAADVTGQPQRLEDLIRGKTLLVAITDRGAGEGMRAWFAAADARAPAVNRVSIISVGVPFFVSDGYARSKAREQVPRPWWHASLFDKDRVMAEKLELDEDDHPYAFAVTGDGQVLAVVHGTPSAPEAGRIWSALSDLDTR